MVTSIFDYTNYREYLKEYYDTQKKLNDKFSHRYFARIAGFKTSSFLRLVMDGKRSLSFESIKRFIKAMKLKKREADYFEALVFFNQSKSDLDRDHYYEIMQQLRIKVKVTGLKKDQYEFYTKKHYAIIREMVALPHFKEDYEWLAGELKGDVEAFEVKKAIDLLLRLELLKRDDAGKLYQRDTTLSTPAEVSSRGLFMFQNSMLRSARDALLSVPAPYRDFTSVTVPIPMDQLPKLKKMIEKFRGEVINFINAGSDNYSGVFQFNLQLFPVTKLNNNKEEK